MDRSPMWRRWPIRLAALAVSALAVSAAAVVIVADGDALIAEEVLVPAPRGRILDRHGVVLVEDRLVDGATVRHRPYGSTAAHLLGRVGTSSGSRVGTIGVELMADRDLRGVPGRIVYEVDADGVPVRERTDLRRQPVPGRDVRLALDLDLQQLLEESLAAAVEQQRGTHSTACRDDGCSSDAGASVALDPATGDVLAMASYPTFDPALLESGDEDAYDALTNSERAHEHRYPLLNRVLSGAYPPGFTIAPFVAHAAVETEVVAVDEWYHDATGRYSFSSSCDISVPPDQTDCYLQNPGAAPSGGVDLRTALTMSSHTYLYRVGDLSWRRRATIGEDALQDQVRVWGFGSRRGFGLDSELPGRVPTPAWLSNFDRRLNGEPTQAGVWKSGTSAMAAVGQGDLVATPLQIAGAHAALADHGRLRRPRVVLSTEAADGSGSRTTPVTVDETIAISEALDTALRGGLNDAVYRGTAATVFAGYDDLTCRLSGLTGTGTPLHPAQDSTGLHTLTVTDPDGAARLTMATVVEGGGYGARSSAPVSRVVADAMAAADCDPTAVGPAERPVAELVAAIRQGFEPE